jgi:hypothetical protein
MKESIMIHNVHKPVIEVFKTNVKDKEHADMLLERILNTFGYRASFDLEDCDRVLRVVSTVGVIEIACLIKLLEELLCEAEVLI